MKTNLCLVIALWLFTISVRAQSPQKMSYQAIVRNSNNNLVINHVVGIRVSILFDSPEGQSVYTEFQLPSSNSNGLVTMKIGDGIVSTGNFSKIDWSKGNYFIKNEIDPAGGSNYIITSVTQLLSVPYALYADRSGSDSNKVDKIEGRELTENNYSSVEKNKLNGISSGAEVNVNADWNAVNGDGQILNKPVTVSGYGITDAVTIAGEQILTGKKTYTGTQILLGVTAIGTATPSPSAVLEVSSTSRGFLPPRMTQEERDGIAPVEGLTIYNKTTKKPNYFDGVSWKSYDGSSAQTVVSVGDHYQGGIVAYILQPSDLGYDPTIQHGLIAAPNDQGIVKWYSGTYSTVGGTETAIGKGLSNTMLIVNNQGNAGGGYAAKLCVDLVIGSFSDWYLPSLDELTKLYQNRTVVGGFAANGVYWSSTEHNSQSLYAWYVDFKFSGSYASNKDTLMMVRAIRTF